MYALIFRFRDGYMPDEFTRKFHPEIALLMDMIITVRKLRSQINIHASTRPELLIVFNG